MIARLRQRLADGLIEWALRRADQPDAPIEATWTEFAAVTVALLVQP